MRLSWLHRWGQWVFGQETWLFCLAQLNLRRMNGKRYESTFRHFVSMLPSQGTVLDIGANIGVMSVYLKRTNPSWNVIAIEPIPIHVNVMRRVFNKFSLTQIQIIETAVGDLDGKIQMQLPIQDGVVKHGLAHIKGHQASDENGQAYEVTIQRIDALITSQSISQIIGIKIDVENYELEVLKGAIQTIKKYQPILMIEMWNDAKKSACIQIMHDIGYEIKVLERGKLIPYKGQDMLDYFFIPSNHL